MRYYKIQVDEKVWDYLKSKAEPFEDTPNSVLSRLLFRPGNHQIDTTKFKPVRSSELCLPRGIPRALEQILEVIYEVKKFGRSRTEATNIVADRRGTAPQTIIDKYCRQLSKRAYEIDDLLEEQSLSGFSLLLKNKFRNYKAVIDTFFESMAGREEPERRNEISVCRNKASNQYFIFLEDTNDGKALLITPEGKIKALDPELFDEAEEEDKNYLLSHNLITEPQIDKFHEFASNVFPVSDVTPRTETTILTPGKRMTEDDLIPHIIEVLKQHGGRAPKELVDEEIYQKFQSLFDEPWYQELVSGSIPRWKHHVAWAKERAKHRGLVKWPNQSGHGIWEVSESAQ